jgi:hypothetical protein
MFGGTAAEFAKALASSPPRAPWGPLDFAEHSAWGAELTQTLDMVAAAKHEQDFIAGTREKLHKLLGGKIYQLPRSESTSSAYERDLGAFRQYCERNGLTFLPAQPEVVAAFLLRHCGQEGKEKPRLAARILNAIRGQHLVNGFLSPTQSPFVRGMCRKIAEWAAEAKKAAESTEKAETK